MQGVRVQDGREPWKRTLGGGVGDLSVDLPKMCRLSPASTFMMHV